MQRGVFPHHLPLLDMHASRAGDRLGHHADRSDDNLAHEGVGLFLRDDCVALGRA